MWHPLSSVIPAPASSSPTHRSFLWKASSNCPLCSPLTLDLAPPPLLFHAAGVFRDLFVNQMLLLDRAVKLAAELDEPESMNFVRKHAREQAEEMGCNIRDAATRIFSNASGSYSSNVNLAVENSSWSDEAQLQEMYMKRKSFAFNSDRWASRLLSYLSSASEYAGRKHQDSAQQMS